MIPCRECGCDSGWTEELINAPLFGGNYDVAVCDPCVDKYHKAQAEENNFPRQDITIEPLENLIPMGYRESNPNQLPLVAQKVLPEILSWSPLRTKGLYIMGASRQGCSAPTIADCCITSVRRRAFMRHGARWWSSMVWSKRPENGEIIRWLLARS